MREWFEGRYSLFFFALTLHACYLVIIGEKKRHYERLQFIIINIQKV